MPRQVKRMIGDPRYERWRREGYCSLTCFSERGREEASGGATQVGARTPAGSSVVSACSRCGTTVLPTSDNFCPSCGEPFVERPSEPKEESSSVGAAGPGREKCESCAGSAGADASSQEDSRPSAVWNWLFLVGLWTLPWPVLFGISWYITVVYFDGGPVTGWPERLIDAAIWGVFAAILGTTIAVLRAGRGR